MLNILFYLSVFTLSLGQLAVLSRGGGFVLYAFDLVVGLFAVYGVFHFLTDKKKFHLNKNIVGFLLFTVLAFFLLLPKLNVLSNVEFVVSISYLVRFLVYVLAALVVSNMVEQKMVSSRRILDTFLASAVLISILGFIQLVIFPDFSLYTDLGWDPHKNRLLSTFFDPNFTGGYLALVLGVFLGLFLEGKVKLNKKYLASVVIVFVALFLTFSRSSWGMFAVIVFLYGALKYRWLLLVGALFMFLTYFAVPRVQTRLSGITDPSDSAAFRLISWNQTLEIAKDNLLTGVGFNSFRYAKKDYGYTDAGSLGGHSGSGSDSSFLLVLATTGIFGFIIFVGSYLSGVSKANLVFAVPLVALIIHSQFVNSLFFPQILFLWSSFLVLD